MNLWARITRWLLVNINARLGKRRTRFVGYLAGDFLVLVSAFIFSVNKSNGSITLLDIFYSLLVALLFLAVVGRVLIAYVRLYDLELDVDGIYETRRELSLLKDLRARDKIIASIWCAFIGVGSFFLAYVYTNGASDLIEFFAFILYFNVLVLVPSIIYVHHVYKNSAHFWRLAPPIERKEKSEKIHGVFRLRHQFISPIILTVCLGFLTGFILGDKKLFFKDVFFGVLILEAFYLTLIQIFKERGWLSGILGAEYSEKGFFISCLVFIGILFRYTSKPGLCFVPFGMFGEIRFQIAHAAFYMFLASFLGLLIGSFETFRYIANRQIEQDKRVMFDFHNIDPYSKYYEGTLYCLTFFLLAAPSVAVYKAFGLVYFCSIAMVCGISWYLWVRWASNEELALSKRDALRKVRWLFFLIVCGSLMLDALYPAPFPIIDIAANAQMSAAIVGAIMAIIAFFMTISINNWEDRSFFFSVCVAGGLTVILMFVSGIQSLAQETQSKLLFLQVGYILVGLLLVGGYRLKQDLTKSGNG